MVNKIMAALWFAFLNYAYRVAEFTPETENSETLLGKEGSCKLQALKHLHFRCNILCSHSVLFIWYH